VGSNSTGEGKTALPVLYSKETETKVPAEKIPEPWHPITNGPTSTVHSATAQLEGGAHDIVTRERMEHNEVIFLTKPENSLLKGIEPRT
jgi:hypothetical protein